MKNSKVWRSRVFISGVSNNRLVHEGWFIRHFSHSLCWKSLIWIGPQYVQRTSLFLSSDSVIFTH